MNYAQIRSMDVSNGEGIGVALFVSGCPFHCEGCFNSEAWDYEYGHEFTNDTLNQLYNLIDKPYIERLTILGGEPLADNNLEMVQHIISSFKIKYPTKSIWIYTGYKYENLSEEQLTAISKADVLVDGQFIENQKDIQLKFRGSRNQRVIDIGAMRNNNNLHDIIIKSGYEKS